MDKSDIIIYNTQDGKASVSLLSKAGSVWMTQGQLAELFSTTKQNISLHIANILEEQELNADSVVKDYLTTAADGKNYTVTHYALDMILAIGFRVRSKRGTQFRQWANTHLIEYMEKGFIMDDERLKNPGGRLDYFDEMLARIRDIRASEKRFYQKIKDLLALSSDYDAKDQSAQLFFAETQNKILFAITGQTAVELVLSRANATKPNMALTAWKGQVVRKHDIYIAKNYLSADEIDSLNRFVVVFLETAELRAKNRQDITIDFWRSNIDKIIELNDKPVLDHQCSVSNQQMEDRVDAIYAEFDRKRKTIEAKQADQDEDYELTSLIQIERLEQQIKQNKS